MWRASRIVAPGGWGIEILKNGEAMVKKHDGKSWIVDDLWDDLWDDIMIWDDIMDGYHDMG